MNKLLQDAAERAAHDAAAMFNAPAALFGEQAEAPPDTEASGLTLTDAPVESDDEAIQRLARLDRLAYDRQRKGEAERMGVRADTLDKQVQAAREAAGGGAEGLQGQALRLDPPERWPHAIDGAELLDALAEFFRQHASLAPGAAELLAVWTVHTFCFDAARHTPRLAITSPEKGCGKTTVLDLLGYVTCKALPTANVTAAALFRVIELAQPTLLVDEADTFLHESEELRGVLNSGNKRGGQVLRCIGDDAEPRAFATFAPAAIAAIGTLPGTVADRAITIRMRRASAAEKPAPIRQDTEAAGAVLARKAARWAADTRLALVDADPALSDGMANREADNWRILFAIAGAAGGKWPDRLAAAAASLRAGDDGRESLGVMLLRDVRAIFAEAGAERLPTADIVRAMVAMEDRPWPEMPGNGKPLTAAAFTRKVKPFGAGRMQWRLPGSSEQVWGYRLDDFADAFARYLAPASPAIPEKTGDMVTMPISSAFSGNSEVVTGNHVTSFKVVTDRACHHFESPANPQKSANVTMSPLFPEDAGRAGETGAAEGASDAEPPSAGGWV